MKTTTIGRMPTPPPTPPSIDKFTNRLDDGLLFLLAASMKRVSFFLFRLTSFRLRVLNFRFALHAYFIVPLSKSIEDRENRFFLDTHVSSKIGRVSPSVSPSVRHKSSHTSHHRIFLIFCSKLAFYEWRTVT